jgi:hypothetical protein
MVRRPYFWLLSTLRNSYGKIKFLERSSELSARLRCRIEFDGESHANLIRLWRAYYRAYLEQLAGRSHVLFVKLEDLVQRPLEILRDLDRFLRLRPNVDLQRTIATLSNRPAKVHGEPCVHGEAARREYVSDRVPTLFPQDTLRFVNQQLDLELMHLFDYDVVGDVGPVAVWSAPVIERTDTETDLSI